MPYLQNRVTMLTGEQPEVTTNFTLTKKARA